MPSSIEVDDILGGSKTILDLAAQALSFAPIPGLDVAATALSSIIAKVQQTRGNDETARDLARSINELATRMKTAAESVQKIKSEMVSDSQEAEPNVESSALNERVKVLQKRLKELEKEADEIPKHKFTAKFFRSGQITIEMLVDDMANEVRRLVRGVANIQHGVSDIRHGVSNVEYGVSNIQYRQDREHDGKILEALPHADASYRSAGNASKSTYLEGTRTALLDELYSWATGMSTDLQDRPVYVLSGAAGTGKSTIAYEMARRLEEEGLLGASFFFLRGSEDRNSTRLVFSTLAYQLAQLQPILYPHIVGAAEDHLKRGVQQQMEFVIDELITGPLRKVSSTAKPSVIIIDAVDECTEAAQELVPRMLHLLLRCMLDLRDQFPLRVLITTRPELHIEQALESADFSSITKPFMLHDIPRVVVDKDIELYLEKRIHEIPSHAELLSTHPETVSMLTKVAEGLFIYAKLAVDFLHSDPDCVEENLNLLLSSNPHDGTSALDPLDKLYLTVLESAFPNVESEKALRDRMRKVLGGIAMLRDHLSVDVWASLMGLKANEIRSVIRRLGAVLIFNLGDSKSKLYPLHASFPQFLIDHTRCTKTAFYVDPKVQNRSFAEICLSLLVRDGVLRRNMCRLSNPLLHKDEIPDLSTRVQQFIPEHVQYTCLHWAFHVCDSEWASPDVDDLVNLVQTFYTKKLLFWMETLSFMGRLDVGVTALLNIRDWYKMHATIHDDTFALLNDAYRFILEYYTPIDICPEQLYISGLAFAPSCRLVDVYSREIDTSLVILPKRDHRWSACLRAIEVPDNHPREVHFSAGDHRIVTCCDSGYIYTFDAHSGAALNVMGSEDGAKRNSFIDISISPDSTQLLDAFVQPHAEDGSLSHSDIQVWNATSGALVRRLILDDIFTTTSYSPDGDRIIIVTPSGLHTLDARTGEPSDIVKWQPQLSLPGDHGFYHCTASSVYFSSDQTQVVSLAADKTLYIYDGNTGHLRHTLEHTNTIWSTAFFPDGAKLVSSGKAGRVYIWDLISGECLQGLKGHNGAVVCVAVSTAGDRIASSGSDLVVCLWDSCSGSLLTILRGHTSWVGSLSFSSDGDRLASSSADKTVRIWDITAAEEEAYTALDTTTWVEGVEFSSDGMYLASITERGVRIWTLLFTASKADDQLRIVALFAPSVALWDVCSGELVAMESRSQHSNHGMCVSLDGEWIAATTRHGSDSRNMTWVTVWKASDLSMQWASQIEVMAHSMQRIRFSSNSARVYVYVFDNAHRDAGTLHIRACSSGEVLEPSEEETEFSEEQEYEIREHQNKFYVDDGWIYSKELGGTALCWLPPSLRRHLIPKTLYMEASFHRYFAVGSGSGSVTLLNLSNLICLISQGENVDASGRSPGGYSRS
ncbi:Vegetative incompatibility protein HET-E-1 [Grifola frondosa]|uniref:Vegetative incompatibility protein HET-E-1 n=1 Tax=Grifola frondosa TaxID=5627 RepID=A0A1C7LN37_GRIFR|nr:Vegetative incompatibility protein HET-E-1 [Grifola frondosa]